MVTRRTNFLICVLAGLLWCTVAGAKDFTLVLDAGHGGNDPGAVGSKVQEKVLTLEVTLLVGKLVEERCPDVKVVYTRKTDKTVALKDRPLIANKANGDFFISIHANANNNKRACGTETYIIGLDKTNANFEVAKRENAVILLEKDKESYKGFNPNSPDSYIMFELMQDLYTDQSLQMADLIQKSFNKLTDRSDRGVRQGPFWVLHQTKMPSVLVEMGFVSNASDQDYMLSKDGKNAIAESIASAFETYKRDYDKKCGKDTKAEVTESKEKPQSHPQPKAKPVEKKEQKVTKSKEVKPSLDGHSVKNDTVGDTIAFKVQLFVVGQLLPEGDAAMKGETALEHYEEGGLIKYTTVGVASYEEALQLQKKMREKFPDCFMIAFFGDKKVSVKEARAAVKK